MDIFRKVRGLKDGKDEQNAIETIADRKHIVIDDLGVGKMTDFALAVVYEVIDYRDMNLIDGMIITSNLSLTQLAGALGDDRVTSRIAGMCKVVNITGPDRRIK
jgi:DNA replication protein DnaC